MSSISSSMSLNSQIVLPPIVVNEKDRQFLQGINDWIRGELSRVNQVDPEQRFVVHRQAFDKIISYVTAYKSLLIAIKAEYEDCIDIIRRGQQEAQYLNGKLSEMVNEPGTLQNNRRRADELKYKMSVIEADNEQLRHQQATMNTVRLEREQRHKEMTTKPNKSTPLTGRRPIPGLTVQQSTDINFLTQELEKLDQHYKELSLSHRTRYEPTSIRESLKSELDHKVQQKEKLEDHVKQLKLRQEQLTIALAAANEYLSVQPPHQTIGEVVLKALSTHKTGGRSDSPKRFNVDSFDVDDPVAGREAELYLDYVDKFTELFEDGKYAEAARHAANSPKGILRTPETMMKFMDLSTNIKPSPWLLYCDALMSTAAVVSGKPNDYMSEHCVRCTLHEHRIDLLSHWIGQDRLSLSELIGDLIYLYWSSSKSSTSTNSTTCLSLAQKVYVDVKSHAPAIVCMIKQCRFVQALEYAQNNDVSYAQLGQVLKRCPDEELVEAFYKSMNKLTGKPLMPVGAIVTSLNETEIYNVGLALIQDIYVRGTQKVGHVSSPLRAAVAADDVTTQEQWVDIVQQLQIQGHREAAMDLLSAVTARFSTDRNNVSGSMNEALPLTVRDLQEGKRGKKFSSLKDSQSSSGDTGTSESTSDDLQESSIDGYMGSGNKRAISEKPATDLNEQASGRDRSKRNAEKQSKPQNAANYDGHAPRRIGENPTRKSDKLINPADNKFRNKKFAKTGNSWQ